MGRVDLNHFRASIVGTALLALMAVGVVFF
jgi:hypothetical protein